MPEEKLSSWELLPGLDARPASELNANWIYAFPEKLMRG